MSPVIHMETEQVRIGARQLGQAAEQLQLCK